MTTFRVSLHKEPGFVELEADGFYILDGSLVFYLESEYIPVSHCFQAYAPGRWEDVWEVDPTKEPFFFVGDRVRVKEESSGIDWNRGENGGLEREVATIKCFMNDFAEGAVHVYPPLEGSRYWNVSDLEKVK